MSKVVSAPWTDEQLEHIKIWQNSPRVHPYTCLCGKILKPTKNGLVCDCGYIQVEIWDFTFSIDET